jgi:hypothetical protein
MTSPGESQAEPAPPPTRGDAGQPGVIDTGVGIDAVKPAGIVLLALDRSSARWRR